MGQMYLYNNVATMYQPVQAPCPLVCWCWCAAGAVHLWAAQGGENALIVLTGGWWVIITELSILMDLELSINICCPGARV